ncbi:MAG TPA: tetratricopeptide repeat protein [Chloroflexia bacterium]|nr:tetratricopeptide repeat protein [Chloroflexia bacterium]
MQETMPFGARLRAQRRARDLTQAALAERAACSVDTIKKLEAGRARASRQLAGLLAVALAVPPAEQEAFIQAARQGEGAWQASDVEAGSFAAPASAAAPPFEVPVAPTRLIGRDGELRDLGALLRRSDGRLLTLTGPPGTGKTRLALAVASAVAADFTHGVLFVPLAAVREPAAVLPALARALGLQEADEAALEPALVQYLRPRHLLLILDNFEQVVTAAVAVAALLAGTPHLRVLVTSRTPLRVRGEREYAVAPLALPDAVTPPAPDAAAAVPAVALFLARAEEVQPGFQLSAANTPTVLAICRRLDGLPLALELAAARLKLLDPAALLARLDQRLPLLSGGARDLPERQQTLRAAIAWSYDLLDGPAQRLFRQLAVFRAGCTPDAAAAVGAADLDTLGRLIDSSLVRRQDGAGGEARVGMLETLHEYAQEQQATAGEAAPAARAHAAYFAGLAEAAEPQLVGAHQAIWYARLNAEYPNLQAALEWAAAHEPALLLRLAGALGRFWWIAGAPDARRWLAAAEALSDSGTPAQQAKLLAWSAHHVYWNGDLVQGAARFRRALALYRQLDDAPGTAFALNGLGNVVRDQGDAAGALPLYEESLQLRRVLGAQPLVAVTLLNLSQAARNLGHADRARALAEESATIQRATGNLDGLTRALEELASQAIDSGAIGRAEDLLEEALAIARTLGSRTVMASTAELLGWAALGAGDLPRAGRHLRESLTIMWELGLGRKAIWPVQGLAAVAHGTGRTDHAARLLGAAAAWHVAMDFPIAPHQRADWDRRVAQVRGALDPAAWAAAWDAGQAWTPEQAVAAALGE